MSRRLLDCGEHLRSLPAERRPRNCIRKNADCPPGLRNSHEFRYSSDAKDRRRPLDCGEHRRSLPARSAVRVAAFPRMQIVRQDFGTLTSSATVLTPRIAGGPWTAASIAALSRRGAPSPQLHSPESELLTYRGRSWTGRKIAEPKRDRLSADDALLVGRTLLSADGT